MDAKRAGIDILKHDNVKPLIKRTYTVQYHCCGKISTVKHDTLLSRIKTNAKLCLQCASKGRNEARIARKKEREHFEYGFVMPFWPVPNSVKREIENEV